jgi:hypothetical protein
VLPRHRDASAAWHSARACRLLHALLRALVVSRAMSCPRAIAVRAEEKVGQCSQETAPLQSGLSYFFFAFLAFLAAFFAFFAIVPPEGVLLVPDGDSGLCGGAGDGTESQRFTSRCLSLPPSYQM